MTIVDFFGWLGTAAAIAAGMPQLIRLIRTRSVDGLSLRAWQAILAVNIGWTSHGFLIGQPPQIVASVLAACSTIPIVVLFARHSRSSVLLTMLPGIVTGSAMIAIDVLLGSAAFGVIATVVGIVSTIGQSIALVRADDVRGVSIGFLLIGVVNQGAWTVWAFLVVDPGTIVTTTSCLVVAGFNLLWYLARLAGLPAFRPIPSTDPHADLATTPSNPI